ncbi:MAG: hypothetical protein IJG52_03480 [Lachnospiraceae bacterium]|nr:hypothetical protein [Lachnospiraceae bacterium]
MSKVTIVLLVILVILVIVLIALYFFGKRMQKRQEAQQEQLQASKQPVTMLVIDKKKLPLKEAGLPSMVYEQTPWYAKRSKIPVVKAKVGPQYVNLVCDDSIFDLIPVKKQIKAMVSGIYIVEVKGLRGALTKESDANKSWFRRQVDKLQEKAGAKPIK